jgi:hypothetical protein
MTTKFSKWLSTVAISKMIEQFWKIAQHCSKMTEFTVAKMAKFTVAVENG